MENIADEIFEKARRGSKESLHELKILGDNNDAEALSKLAEIYLKGLCGEKQLPKKAMEFLHKAAAQNYPPALYRLGDFYYYGKCGLIPDSQKAIEYLTRAAELGETEAYGLLGEIYLYSEGGIEADGYRAIEFFTKAEDWRRVGKIYRDGKCGVTQDGHKAIEIFTKAENWWDIAWIYRDGKAGVVQSGSKAVEYLTRIEAWSSIAEIYEEGCGDIVPNRDRAIEFYERAGDSYRHNLERLATDKENLQELMTFADSDNAEALCELAEVYLKGLNGVEQSPKKALELLEKAAAQDYLPALGRLVDFYLHGKCGVKQDGYKAIEYFLKVYKFDEVGSARALSYCANIYKEGIGGVKQSGQKTVEYLTRDFEENDAYDSGDEVVQICLYGCGEIKPDWQKAFEFANVPTDGGLVIYSDVYFKFVCVFDNDLGYFRKDGLGTLKVLNDRANRLEKLKAPNIKQADELRRIAEFYEEGYGGLAPNREKAIEFYKKCTELLPRSKNFKDKLAYLIGTYDE